MNATYFALLAGLLFTHAPGIALAEWALPDGAQVHPAYHGNVPRRSDVVFSSRSKRPEAPALAKAFGATRIEWVYTSDQAFVTSLKDAAPWFGGTLNANGPLPSDAGFARDFDGDILLAPWMKAWGGRWITTTHPETRRALSEQALLYLKLGANSIQFDDPQLQYFAAQTQGGDFNPSTVAGFPQFLASQRDQAAVKTAGLAGFTGNYRDFLISTQGVTDNKDYLRRFRSFPSTKLWLRYVQSTVEDYFVYMRKLINDGQPKSVPLSMNISALYEPNEANRFFFLARLADYAIAETQTADLVQMTSQAATARALGMGFVPSIRPLGLAENRVAIATLYALGGEPVVPWDTYAGNDQAGQPKRFFGSVEEYGDLFHFVRAYPALFDGLETAAMVGIVVPVDKFRSETTKDVSKKLTEKQIPYAFVPVGGSQVRYQLDVMRLRHFKLLVTVNPDSDYLREDLETITASKVPRSDAGALTDDVVARLRPFIAAPGGERLRIVARAAPADSSRLVVHVIDTARADQTAVDTECRRRIGVESSLLGPGKISSVTWTTTAETKHLVSALNATQLFVTLPSCPMWGILEFQMAR